jgi:ribose transport system permease protein
MVSTFTGFIGGVPKQFVIALLLAAAGGFILKRTTIGRVAEVMGGNERCAVVTGLPTRPYKVLFYVVTGVLAGIGALMLTSMMAVAEPIAGQFYELDAVAVTVIGGTNLMGGFGTVTGTVVGAVLLGIVRNGLNLVGVPANYQQLIVGLIILIAVIGVGRGKEQRK